MERSGGIVAETYHISRNGAPLTVPNVLTGAGAVGALAGGRRRFVAAASGAAWLAGSALARVGIFDAGRASTGTRVSSFVCSANASRRTLDQSTASAGSCPVLTTRSATVCSLSCEF